MSEAHKTGGELFIVDNSDHEWKVRNDLSHSCQLASKLDVATGSSKSAAYSLLAMLGRALTKPAS